MEKDLFEPIKNYFENQGFVCDGEVKKIDLYMEKENTSVAVELKQTLDFRAVQQAALRQKIVDIVYIGIFMPKNLRSKAYKEKVYVLKRLGIGLIGVSKKTFTVEILNEPIVSELSSFQQKNKKQKEALTKEFQKRKVKSNTGGVHGTKLMTAYREDSLLVLDALLELGGEATTKNVRELSGVEKTTAILHDNYYGWFLKVKKGVYKVEDAGLKAVEEFEDAIRVLKKK